MNLNFGKYLESRKSKFNYIYPTYLSEKFCCFPGLNRLAIWNMQTVYNDIESLKTQSIFFLFFTIKPLCTVEDIEVRELKKWLMSKSFLER